MTVALDASAVETVVEAVLTVRSSPRDDESKVAGAWIPEQLVSASLPQNPALDELASSALARCGLCVPTFVHLLLPLLAQGGSTKRYRLQ
jgi:hypothetical protein